MAGSNLRTNPVGLENVKYDFSSESDAWSSDYFFKSYSDAKSVSEIDVSTNEGLDKFYKIVTEPSAKMWDSESIGKAKKTLVEMATSGLAKNSLKNIKGLAGILDGNTATSLDLSFPGFYTNDSSDSYKNAAKSITYSQEIAQDIEESPDEYFQGRLNGLSDTSKAFWISLKGEVLNADVNIARRKAITSLRAYGSPNDYLAETITTGNKLAEEFSKVRAEFQKEVQAAYTAKTEQAGGYLTAREQAEFDKSFEAREKEMSEKYKQGAMASQAIPKMLSKVQDVAYTTLKKKKEKPTK